jgi:phosphoglycolate phosphatase-like HAD superfamily hydrolase
MVGDTDSDIQFGKALGMFTILVRSKEKTQVIPDLSIDYLADLPKYLL